MTSDLKPYPKMKPSGVPWLGDVPEHWEVKRIGAVFCERGETNEKYEITEVLSVLKDIGVILYSEKGQIGNKKSEDIGRYKIVRPDDLVVNCMNVIIGSVGRSRYTGCLSPVYYVLKRRKSENLPRYLELVFQHKSFQQSLVRIGNGILAHRMRIPMEKLKAELFPLPPLPEQAAIVRYLDYMDRRIRRYIRAKGKLIKLLEEQKQAIIHRAVTRGLYGLVGKEDYAKTQRRGEEEGNTHAKWDKPVKYKPSGVPWLGDVPEHWEVVSLRHRYSQVLGKMLDGKRITGSHSLPYLRNTDVQWDSINVSGLPEMDIPESEYDRYTVQMGDMLVCEGGEVGRCAIWTGAIAVCGFQKALHRLRPRNAGRDTPSFMYYALLSAAKTDAFNDGHVSTIPHLTGDKLRAHRFPFPPLCEQNAIVAFLDAVLADFERMAEVARSEIALLNEYRTRLIADVVTGKLDVREAAERLPDESGGSETIDDTDEAAEEEAKDADDDYNEEAVETTAGEPVS